MYSRNFYFLCCVYSDVKYALSTPGCAEYKIAKVVLLPQSMQKKNFYMIVCSAVELHTVLLIPLYQLYLSYNSSISIEFIRAYRVIWKPANFHLNVNEKIIIVLKIVYPNGFQPLTAKTLSYYQLVFR